MNRYIIHKCVPLYMTLLCYVTKVDEYCKIQINKHLPMLRENLQIDNKTHKRMTIIQLRFSSVLCWGEHKVELKILYTDGLQNTVYNQFLCCNLVSYGFSLNIYTSVQYKHNYGNCARGGEDVFSALIRWVCCVWVVKDVFGKYK